MDTTTAAKMIRSLMNEHGLGHLPFEWDKSVKRFGACHYQRDRFTGEAVAKKITMSHRLVQLNDEAQVRDTALHEIAHALAGKKAGHGPAWKRQAAAIGARPERCYSSADVTPVIAGQWIAECGRCGRVHTKVRQPRPGQRWCRCAGGRVASALLPEFRRATAADAARGAAPAAKPAPVAPVVPMPTRTPAPAPAPERVPVAASKPATRGGAKHDACPLCGYGFKTPRAKCQSATACAKRQAGRA